MRLLLMQSKKSCLTISCILKLAKLVIVQTRSQSICVSLKPKRQESVLVKQVRHTLSRLMRFLTGMSSVAYLIVRLTDEQCLMLLSQIWNRLLGMTASLAVNQSISRSLCLMMVDKLTIVCFRLTSLKRSMKLYATLQT